MIIHSTDDRRNKPVVGLIVNPLAGLGGRVGLKGTDGLEIVREAVRRGAKPRANARAVNALHALIGSGALFSLITAAGGMGEDVARASGLHPTVVYRPETIPTTSSDTKAAAAAFAERRIDLLLFVGGDGTARDVFSVIGARFPMLGVPAGVKMHSAVFGATPRGTGQLSALFLAGDPTARIRDAEIMDLDEAAIRDDRVSAALYGYARSPYHQRFAQNAKSSSPPGDDELLDATVRRVAADMRSGCLYIIGPGTTTRRLATALGLSSTLLGVDAVLDGRLIGADLDEASILKLMERRETHIIVGVLGGQGSLFGRGNQQISATVIRRVGPDRITVIATPRKLIALGTNPLVVDTGDAEVDALLTGYIRVETGPHQGTIFKVQS